MAAGLHELISDAFLSVPTILTWILAIYLTWRFRHKTNRENRRFQYSYLELLAAVVMLSLAGFAFAECDRACAIILSCTVQGIAVGWVYARFKTPPGQGFASRSYPVKCMVGWVLAMFGIFAGGWVAILLFSGLLSSGLH